MKYKTLPDKPTGHEFVRYHLVRILDLAVTVLPLLPTKISGKGLPGDAAASLQQLSPNAASLRRLRGLIPVMVFCKVRNIIA